MAELGAHEFSLTSPVAVTRRRRPRERVPGVYGDADHQFLINICGRYLTLREYRAVRRRNPVFKDLFALLRAAVLYFGVVEMGWPQIVAAKRMGVHRDTAQQWQNQIEDARRDGDVFDRITQVVKGYRNVF